MLLQQLYDATKDKYDIKIIAGEKGLRRNTSWVHIVEDINSSEFLHADELVITTGLTFSSESWLMKFLMSLIGHGASGLIINTGKYIKENDISENVRGLCNQYNFPLFTMPWEVAFYDVTRDYYRMLLVDSNAKQRVNILLAQLANVTDLDVRIDILMELYSLGLRKDANYLAVAFWTSDSNVEQDERICYVAEEFARRKKLACYITKVEGEFYALFEGVTCDDAKCQALIKSFARDLRKEDKNAWVGSSGVFEKLMRFPGAVQNANAAKMYAQALGERYYCYKDMGFYAVLHSVEKRSLMDDYISKWIGDIIDYDETHHTAYLETLQAYLKCDGARDPMAAMLYCHRNTVNYRIGVLKRDFGLDLGDPEVKHGLWLAFQMARFFTIFEKEVD